MHLLLVEDDLDLGASLQRALRQARFTSEWVRTLHDGRVFPTRNHYDCLLLDLSLPDGSGLDLLHRWRREGIQVPIIVITANSALDARLKGLDGGADDYVVKPFAVEELVSRIHAVTRRAARQADSRWRFGPLALDLARHEATLNGSPVATTPTEFNLLLALARSPGAVVAKHRLAKALEPYGEAVDFNAIEVHVHNLRRKFGPDAIRTVRGVGYTLGFPDSPDSPA